jgi:hypothetical protein
VQSTLSKKDNAMGNPLNEENDFKRIDKGYWSSDEIAVNTVWRRWDFLKRQKLKEKEELKSGKINNEKTRARYSSAVKEAYKGKLQLNTL